jgi:hypothetical protein
MMPHWIYQLFIANSLLDCDDDFITYRPVTPAAQGQVEQGTAAVVDTRSNAVLPLFDGSIIVAKRLLDFAIMSTFGLACPVLGLAVAFSVIINASIWILMTGKFLSSIEADNKLALSKLEASTRELLKGAVSGMWIVVFAVCMFWSIMVFDMVADVEGNTNGLVYALVCLFAVPMLLFWLIRLGDQYENDIGAKVTAYITDIVSSRLSLVAMFAISHRDSTSTPQRTPNTSSIVSPLSHMRHVDGINDDPETASVRSDDCNSEFVGGMPVRETVSGNASVDTRYDLAFRRSLQMRESYRDSCRESLNAEL